jgi:hypothetical protein
MPNETTESLQLTRECKDCKGEGEHVSPAWTTAEGKHYPESRRSCSTCEGARTVPAPNVGAILQAITTTRGATKGHRKFRASAPADWAKSTQGLANRRAYYVWRLARFHGGADVTMPMTAELFCGRDAFRAELEQLAEAVARRAFGTDMAAAYRWSSALRGTPVPAGLPPASYPCGPAFDAHKPAWEALEAK